MAALLLSVAGAAGGNALFGPVGAIFGRLAGALVGNVIDHALLGGARSVEGSRLADLDVMTSTEGAPIPRLYGRARLSGQVIWATRLEEVIAKKNNDAVGGKGLGPKNTTTTYSYFANFAVGLCEGPIGNVARIWADGKLLDLTGITWRVHRGDETQMPDPLIVAKDGAENAPAYRGVAYIVFERLPLENFGNRIPQLSFEVTRPIGALEPMVRAVTLIPGTTEFGYAPQTVVRSLGPGQSAPENRHVSYAASDFEVSLDQLQAVCPNLERVALVVAWFGTDLRAAHCALMPGVESREKATQGASWAVGGVTRADAHLISTVDGRPAFGGTPSDESVRAAIAALKARGLKVTLHPFVMMDVPADNALPDPWTGAASQPRYPWRGRITCDPAPGVSGSPDGTGAAATQVAALVGTALPFDFSIAGGQVSYAGPDEWTLRRMALHYANLAVAAGGVDAFVIGSELKGLTRVRSAPGVYPAADALAALAVDVKAIVGSDTVVTYAADYGGRMFALDAIHLWTWDARPYPIFPAAKDVWSDGGNWETGHWLTGRLGAAPLDALVATILADAGIENVVCDDLRDVVEGYVLDRPMAPRAAIEPLALAYAFDAHEDGATLRFRPRGSAPVLSVSEEDLVLADGSAPLRALRAQETELPREASLGFTVAGADYRRLTALSRRLVGGSARTAHADLAVVTDAVAAERRANIWLQDLWVGRETADFALPPSLLRLQPGDVVTLDAGGLTRLIEIREVVDTEQRAIKGRAIDPGVFAVPLLPAHRPSPDVPPALGPVEAVLMELPRLPSDTDDTLVRGAVFASPWPGPVAIWRSIDGASFEVAALASVPNVIGETLDELPPGPTAVWDRATQLRVRLHGGALASLSDLAVLGGGNAAAVRSPGGTWEVLQFANAELVAERTYALSRLLRGQAGSAWAMTDAVPAGAPFVLLDDFIVPVARGLDTLGRAIDLRIVAAGRDHGDPMAVALSATVGATALRPLSPVHIRGRRTEEGVRITFIRRTRIEGDGWGAGEVPLGEASEAYEVDILSGGDAVRTLQATTPDVLYPLADELADFGAAQSSLAIRVVQMSATVGRGFPAAGYIVLD